MDRLTTKEAAAILGYSVSTLRHWRKGSKVWRPGLGPYFFSINGRIFYPKESIDDFLCLCGSTRDSMYPVVSCAME